MIEKRYPVRSQRSAGRGLSQLELLVALVVISLIGVLAVPLVQQGRDAARRQSCQSNLRQLVRALQSYEDAYARFPPAAVWSTDETTSLALHSSKRVDLITHENWAQLLLPFAGEEALSQQFSAGLSIGDPSQSAARLTRIILMTCPDDAFNRADNPHSFSPPGSVVAPIEFARGNYAINGGTHDLQLDVPSTAYPKGDFAHLVMQSEPRRYELWGNGVAGINHSFSLDDFANSQSTLVAVEEIRAGVHALDPRGVWALGQIGGSVTWAHGVAGDAYAPNHEWPRADDVLGCKALHEAVGSEILRQERMPCVDYVDANQQATARSMHPGGVYVACLDGSARFIADQIDPGLWHVIHSRETPAAVLANDFDQHLSVVDFSGEAAASERSTNTASGPIPGRQGPWENTVGMTFVQVPAGEFTMGIPDAGNSADPPPECPAHQVRLTHPFYLSIHEVTRGQFQRVMDYMPSDRPGELMTGITESTSQDAASDQLPVLFVTWDEAVEFCRRLAERSEEIAVGRHYRLPTEAEWEYACRAGSTVPYKWSPSRRAGDGSGDAAGILPPLPIAPVGSKPTNPFGLHDMRGNVWEWTADWFDRDYYARSPIDDPRGPDHGYIKVVRGGDWRFVGETCHIDYSMMPPWKANPYVGFRIVCEITVAPAAGPAAVH